MALPLLPILGAVLPPVVNAIKNAVAPKPAGTIDKDAFLKLLVAQLRYQDPLNPMDNDKFIAQTAQFQTLEELQNIRKGVDSLSGSGGMSAAASGTAFLGRQVTAASAAFTFAGASVALPYTLNAPVPNAAVEITDASGATVLGRIPLGPRAAGSGTLDLNPGAMGKVLPAGQYRYRLVSMDATGAATALPAISGVVTGVTTEGSTAMVLLGNRRIPVTDIVSVGLPN